MNNKLIIASKITGGLIIMTICIFTLSKSGKEAFIQKPDVQSTTTVALKETIPVYDLQRWPEPTDSPVMKSTGYTSDVILPAAAPKRYLLQNPIKINERLISYDSDGASTELRFPQIEGLVDLTAQNKINKDIQGYADRLAEKAFTYRKDLLEARLNYNVTANYNNILCININENIKLTDHSYLICETLLYELIEGTKLELKDVFRKELSFPEVLNSAIDEFFLRNNLEEDMLISPFLGIRENQNYELNENKLIIRVYKNEEIQPSVAMMFRPNEIEFELNKYSNVIDIFDKYSNPGKQLYRNKITKRRMLPNNFKTFHRERNYNTDTYAGTVFQIEFMDMENSDFQKKINGICSYSGEEEFKKLLPDNLEKTNDINSKPRFTRGYFMIANYGDVISIENTIGYSIPGEARSQEAKHFSYNVKTGKKLELQDIFRKNIDFKKAISDYINPIANERNLNISEANIEAMLNKADFWFDNEFLWLNFKPEEYIADRNKNPNLFSVPFEYFGEENLVIRE